MFGYVKKETIVDLIKKEVDLTRKSFDKYRALSEIHSTHRHEDECHAKEAAKYEELANEYFSRYLEAKEILSQIDKL